MPKIQCATRTVTSAYPVVLVDSLVRANAVGGGFSVTLPSPGLCVGYSFEVKKIDASANVVTVVGTVDGDASYLLPEQWQFVTFKSNGTSYDMVAAG